MEWSRRNIRIICILLVLGFGSGGAIYVHQEGGWKFTMFRFQKWLHGVYGGDYPTATASEVAEAKKKAKALTVKLLAKHPELHIQSKSVATERNGFLAFLQIKDDQRLKNLMSSEIIKNRDKEISNPAEVERDLKLHEEIGLEIEKIAMMTEQSTEGLTIEYDGYFPAGEFKAMADYLLLKARVAAMYKDADMAFHFISMAVQLTNHLYDIEKPTFMTETIFVMCRLSIWESVMNHVLPQIGAEADLVKWRSLLKLSPLPGDRFAKMIRGEWYFLHDVHSHTLFIINDDIAVPDPESFIDVHAAICVSGIQNYKGKDVHDLLLVKQPDPESFGVKLSRESIYLSRETAIAGGSWIKGYIRKYTIEAQHDAALDMLIREKAGEDISKLSETYVLNPFSGKPFPYDGAKRLLPNDPSSPDYTNELKLPW